MTARLEPHFTFTSRSPQQTRSTGTLRICDFCLATASWSRQSTVQMTVPLSIAARRGIVLAAAIVLAASLSYFSMRNALAVHYAGLQSAEGYARAVRLEPGDPRNWYLLGRFLQYNLEDPDTPRAIHAYLTALSLNPGSAEIWTDLATAYESEGNLVSARDAFVHAERAYPLSAEVAWRYGNFLLRQGEVEPALAEMRHAVKGDTKRAAEAFSRSLAAGATADVILDRALPPIADAYVDVISDQINDHHTENALKVWDRLAAIHPRLPIQDSFPVVSALRAERRIAEARRVWDQATIFAGLVDLQGPPGSILWDGGFESGIIGGSYSWVLPEGVRGVQVNFDSREKHSGNRSLLLIFEGESNINFTGLCHSVPVQPSTAYRFSAWIKTKSLTTDQGLRFQLNALGTQNPQSVVTPEVHGTVPWMRVEMPWSSGIDVQEMQVCLVRFMSDQSDNRIQGMAWVDDVALSPEPAESSRQ